MEYSTLANGYKIGKIGLGTYLIPKEKTIETVVAAIKAGYRHIDTAQAYENEEEIGYAIAQCISEGIVKREDLFITSKISPHNKIGYQEAIDAINSSLKKMDLDYIDLYLIHWPNVAPGAMWKKLNAETWRGFEECYEKGLVKNLGVSNFMIHHLEELFKTAKIKPVVNQLHLSPIWQQKEVVNWCNNHNIQCVAWSPLVRFSDWAGGFLWNENYSKCEDWTAETMNELSQKYKRSKAQIALRWSVQKGLIPLAKSIHPERIKENINIFDFEISEEDMEKLDSLNARPSNPDATPDSIYNSWSMAIALNRQQYMTKNKIYLLGIPLIKWKRINNNKSKIYLFGLIPLLKIKKKNNNKKTKYYLFNIFPLLKTVKEHEGKNVYSLFNIIKIAKSITTTQTIQNNDFLPDYCKKESIKEKRENIQNLNNRVFNRFYAYEKFYDNKNISKIHKMFLALKLCLTNKVPIASLDVHITTACTLKCKACSHKIPYYKTENHHVMSIDEFKHELDIILKNVDCIYNLLLLGGEPLLHKELDKFIQYANSKKQVKRIVIVTNGTLLPSKNVIKALQNSSKTLIFISSYEKNKSLKNYKPKEICELCENNKIRYVLAHNNSWWRQPEINLYNSYSNQEIENNFFKCDFKYCTLLSGGKIYPCAYAKYINDETQGKYNKDFIDLHTKISPKNFKNFFKCSSYKVCECCDMTHYGELIFPAVQLREDLHEQNFAYRK